jgi:tRNA(Ile)-lysidine synthase
LDNLILDFSASDLLKKLHSLTRANKYLVAYSGGLDSHVLLHLMSQLSDSEISIRAMYINHGLQKEARDWEIHCHKVCDELCIPFNSKALQIQTSTGVSLEEEARKKRYSALNTSLQKDEVLLTAHHQNDQAETLLLQLFRGAGVQGLAAMPAIREFGSKENLRLHARPILNQTRQFLEAYAKENQLDFIEDPSNFDESFDRNFLRNIIMPQLRQRWPGIDKTISRPIWIFRPGIAND